MTTIMLATLREPGTGGKRMCKDCKDLIEQRGC
jgi:hypothetical protein